MAIGRFLFPTFIVGFLGFFLAFLFTTTVTPAPLVVDSKLPRAALGDGVIVEITGFYELDGARYVWFSTQEERTSSFTPGPIAPGYQTAPLRIDLAADSAANLTGLMKALLGKRAGEHVETGAVPPRELVGDWEATRSLPREYAAFPYLIHYDGTFELTPGTYFNATEYVQYWRGQGYDLAVDSEWPCEGTTVWACRVTTLDYAANVFEAQRLAQPGVGYPVTSLLAQLSGDVAWNFSVVPHGETFGARLDPPAGSTFQLGADLRGPYEHGTYRVLRLTDSTMEAEFSSATPRDARIIGLTTYFEMDVIRIVNPG